jgi:outer membrane immunogenic protein
MSILARDRLTIKSTRSMKLRFITLSALIAIAPGLVPSSSMADGYTRPPGACAAVPFIGWTDFYVGGQVGGAWSAVDWANANVTGERVNNDASGFIGGGQVGYNKQFGNLVLGAEATLSGTALSGDFRSTKPAAWTYSTDISTIATVTGRQGFAVDQWLVYAKAGWAGGHVDVSGIPLLGPTASPSATGGTDGPSAPG